jgi:N-acetylglucosaminyldiphosphoundecaprenol N-acetyl-beta-D-mannosaminyltransferase
LVAFGAPKQEIWLSEKGRKITSLKLGIGVGGTFDFWAGKIKRAPILWRKIGLEWLWRLIQEPQRWRRIFNAIVVFPYRVIQEKIYRFFSVSVEK